MHASSLVLAVTDDATIVNAPRVAATPKAVKPQVDSGHPSPEGVEPQAMEDDNDDNDDNSADGDDEESHDSVASPTQLGVGADKTDKIDKIDAVEEATHSETEDEEDIHMTPPSQGPSQVSDDVIPCTQADVSQAVAVEEVENGEGGIMEPSQLEEQAQAAVTKEATKMVVVKEVFNTPVVAKPAVAKPAVSKAAKEEETPVKSPVSSEKSKAK
jgi:hypothetical protein